MDLVLRIVDAVAGLPTPLLYMVIVFWLVAESAAVPIPNEAILLCSGFLVGRGDLNLVVAWIASLVGTLAGASLARWIGLRFGRPGVEKVGRYVLLSAHRLEAAEGFFRRRGGATIFLARLTPVVRTVISYPAGLADMAYRPFAVATLLGAGIWNLAMLLIGREVGQHWLQIFQQAHNALLLFGFMVIVAIVVYMVIERQIKRRYQAETP
jgi:membrane protein DedA with SNARE-associated domain